jgi:hypothetical protein
MLGMLLTPKGEDILSDQTPRKEKGNASVWTVQSAAWLSVLIGFAT